MAEGTPVVSPMLVGRHDELAVLIAAVTDALAVDAVRSAGEAIGRLHLTHVAGALRPLLPELAGMLPGLPDPLGDPAGERHRMSAA